jgi:hypothetical protein
VSLHASVNSKAVLTAAHNLVSHAWGVGMRFFPLKNSAVYIPWKQEGQWHEIGPKHRRRSSIYLLIYNIFSHDFNGVWVVRLVWSAKMLSEIELEEYGKKRSQAIITIQINLLKTECRLLHLKTQSVPRCKHFSSRL